MPSSLLYQAQRPPASYLNVYIANDMVLVPAFGAPEDEPAGDSLQACVPNREAVPIDASSLVWGLGSCHRLTQEIPAV